MEITLHKTYICYTVQDIAEDAASSYLLSPQPKRKKCWSSMTVFLDTEFEIVYPDEDILGPSLNHKA